MIETLYLIPHMQITEIYKSIQGIFLRRLAVCFRPADRLQSALFLVRQ